MPTRNSRQQQSSRTVHQILSELKSRGDPKALEGMSRFGIQTDRAYGVSVPRLRSLARTIGSNHSLALQLWKTGVHDARLLAGMIDDPSTVTPEQMDEWALEFDSWDVVDGSCGNLFDNLLCDSESP
jgi:3-methyladenine DNA glycosylase AlkD